MLDQNLFTEMLQLYYQMMGWDSDGRPTRATLLDYQLEWVDETS